MSNVIERAEDFLARSIKSSASADAVYTRGSTAVTLKAAFGKRMMEARQNDGSVMVANVRTVLFTFADLGFEPKAGDRIASGGEKWVVGLPGLTASFEYIGTTKTMIRVYLRKDNEEEPAG